MSQYSEWLKKSRGSASINSRSDIPKTLPGTTLILARR